MSFENTVEFAKKLDETDPLRKFRDHFIFPIHESGTTVYLNGNSLGLQPVLTTEYITKEIEDWKKYGVEGHFHGDTPWLTYQEMMIPGMARLVGAMEEEIALMNTLTVNLHLMMVSFYQPTSNKYKILMEYSPFPSDIYAIKSQINFHGYDPEDALIFLKPSDGEIVTEKDIELVFTEQGDSIALVLIGGINYYTGQVYPMEKITQLGHDHGAIVGFDLAHAVGNAIDLKLHEWGVDFAVWCTYKYLNSGPGAIAGCFVHQNHRNTDRPRFAGWWGHNKETRFLMGPDFDPIPGAEGWQLSNAPVFGLAPIRASMHLFDQVEIETLIVKRQKIIDYTRYLLSENVGDKIEIITPIDPDKSGCQLSISIHDGGKAIHEKLLKSGVYCDWREPNVIRIAFASLYNNYEDAYHFVSILKAILEE